MQLAGPAINWFHLRRTMHRDKEHRYFRCPSCGQQLRVPKGKGKITVTCRSCGAVFQEKKLKIHVPPRPFPGLGGLFSSKLFLPQEPDVLPKEVEQVVLPSSREAIWGE